MKLTKRADGRWHKKLKMPDGKTKYFYSSEPTERKAEKDITNQLLQYKDTLENGHAFARIADMWDTEYRKKISDLNYRKSVKSAYQKIVDYFDDTPILSVTAQEINIFINSLIAKGYYKKTIATHKNILNMIFSYAVLNGYIKYNPVNDVRLPQNLPKKQRQMPTTNEIKEVSKHYENFDLLPYFLLNTGCRKSEALAITDKDIDFENKIIKIRNHVIHDGNTPIYEPVLKTESAERDIILLDRLAKVLPHNFKGFLFSMNNDGKKPLTKSAFAKRWKKYCETYNLNITAHQLRHGYATMLFEAGIDVKDAQELMGHSDINLTRQIYTHIRSERKKETADKLNNFQF